MRKASEYEARDIGGLLVVVNKLKSELLAVQMKDGCSDNSDLRCFVSHQSSGLEDTDAHQSETGPQRVASAAVAMSKLLDEYRSIRKAVWLHSLQVPFWNPAETTADAEHQKYYERHLSLKMRIKTLQANVGKTLRSLIEEGPKNFGDLPPPTASKYLRAFNALADLEEPAVPVARVRMPCGVGATGGSRKLLIKEDMLGELHKRIVGIH
eukprot:GHVO01010173.1.p1 GENE.GHVO01010173.1~~GHVO01010173.1.p1  ORF type:complete len:210 (-),score=31.98 GHVO01010173.1:82-711(-)